MKLVRSRMSMESDLRRKNQINHGLLIAEMTASF